MVEVVFILSRHSCLKQVAKFAFKTEVKMDGEEKQPSSAAGGQSPNNDILSGTILENAPESVKRVRRPDKPIYVPKPRAESSLDSVKSIQNRPGVPRASSLEPKSVSKLPEVNKSSRVSRNLNQQPKSTCDHNYNAAEKRLHSDSLPGQEDHPAKEAISSPQRLSVSSQGSSRSKDEEKSKQSKTLAQVDVGQKASTMNKSTRSASVSDPTKSFPKKQTDLNQSSGRSKDLTAFDKKSLGSNTSAMPVEDCDGKSRALQSPTKGKKLFEGKEEQRLHSDSLSGQENHTARENLQRSPFSRDEKSKLPGRLAQCRDGVGYKTSTSNKSTRSTSVSGPTKSFPKKQVELNRSSGTGKMMTAYDKESSRLNSSAMPVEDRDAKSSALKSPTKLSNENNSVNSTNVISGIPKDLMKMSFKMHPVGNKEEENKQNVVKSVAEKQVPTKLKGKGRGSCRTFVESNAPRDTLNFVDKPKSETQSKCNKQFSSDIIIEKKGNSEVAERRICSGYDESLQAKKVLDQRQIATDIGFKKIEVNPPQQILDWNSQVEAQEIFEASQNVEKNPRRRRCSSNEKRKNSSRISGTISRVVSQEKRGQSSAADTESLPKASGIIRIVSTSDSGTRSRDFEEFKEKRNLYEPGRPLCIVTPESRDTGQHVNSVENHHRHSVENQHMSYPFGHAYPLDQSALQPNMQQTQHSLFPHDLHEYSDAGESYRTPLSPFGFGHAQQTGFAVLPQMGNSVGIPVPYHQPGMRTMVPEFYVRKKKTATEKNVHEAMLLEMELKKLLGQASYMIDASKLNQLRFKIQLRYEYIVLNDMEFCTKHNVEQMLWKAVFYHVIEWYRQHLGDINTDKEAIRRGYISLLEEGTVFYENLLEKLQEAYEFHLDSFCDCEAVRPTSLPRTVKLALISAQKMTICLGDLARYHEMINEGTNYGKARSWYYKAQKLAPTNGRPYNQLAVLAVFNRRKFDAVFYYMRSLAASNPFQTAKEGLISIFEDVFKKYKETYKVQPEKTPSRQKHRVDTHSRVETWYSVDGHVAYRSGVILDDTESDVGDRNLSALELNKLFSLSFLHVHGKLFSRVGLESFTETCQKMVRQFRHLLHAHPMTLSCHRLLQIITINMYAIENPGRKDCEAFSESSCESSCRRLALDVSIEMFRLMLERCNDVFQQRLTDSHHELPIIRDDVQHILPAIKIWCDWLMSHKDVWSPLPSLTDFGIGAEERYVWIELATFLNLIARIKDKCNFVLHDKKAEGFVPVVLPENHTLSGFVPLVPVLMDCAYVDSRIDKDLARNACRLRKIRLCGEFLSGISPPVLGWDRIKQGYCPMVTRVVDDHEQGRIRLSVEKEQPEVISDTFEAAVIVYDDSSIELTSYNQRLRTMKHNLEREKADQDRQALQSEAVLHEASQSPMHYSKVRPRWLVLDTNCFIDYLPKIETIVTSQKYNLAIPLVVVNELDGLSKGMSRRHVPPAPSSEIWSANVRHSSKCGEDASHALHFLRDRCEERDPRVYALTSKGNLIHKFDFRCETDANENSEKNDDIILSCALRLAERNRVQDNHSKTPKKGDVVELSWDVVLLTDDRHLRIKALSTDFPVVSITEFMERMKVL